MQSVTQSQHFDADLNRMTCEATLFAAGSESFVLRKGTVGYALSMKRSNDNNSNVYLLFLIFIYLC